MKRLILVGVLSFVVLVVAHAQAILPSIMVRPGSSWCYNNGYVKIEDNQGQEKEIYDYTKAMHDPKMLQSIATIEGLLKDEGLKIINLRSKMNSVNDNAAIEQLIDDEEGNVADKGAWELALESAKADIYLDINWSVETIGPKKQLSYTLEGTDAYTGEQVCSVTGTGNPSMSATETVLLREAVIGKMAELKTKLDGHFQKILADGRSVQIGIRVTTGSDVHLMTTVPGGNIGRVIQKWIMKNAVQGRAEATTPGSRKVANYMANIALYDSDGIAMSAEDFAWQLSDYLNADFGVKTMVVNNGLGHAYLYIQGKSED